MPRGGKREGSGRKSKAEELGLRDKLTPMEADFLSALHDSIKEGNPVAMKLYAEYMYGKPTDKLDLTSGGKEINAQPHVVIFKDYTKDAAA